MKQVPWYKDLREFYWWEKPIREGSSGERGLTFDSKIEWMANEILLSAIHDLKLGGVVGKEATEWIKEKSQAPFGFYWCLEKSGRNPNTMRKLINGNGRISTRAKNR